MTGSPKTFQGRFDKYISPGKFGKTGISWNDSWRALNRTQIIRNINHPIDVAEMLWRVGRVRDLSVIVAAILHDTVEDTDATPEEIERLFLPRGERTRHRGDRR